MQAFSAALGLGSGLFDMGSGLRSMPNGPGISPMMSVIAGGQQQFAYQQEANAESQQSTFALQDSLLQAAQNDYNVQKVKAEQDAQYAVSGVNISGSPLAVMTETQMLGDQVSNQIRQRGQLESMLYSEQGLQYLRQGSAAAFSGIADAMNYNYQYQLQKAEATNSAIGAGISGIGAAAGALSGAKGLGGSIGSLFSGFGAGGSQSRSISGMSLPNAPSYNMGI